jgi:hypothetical protein
VTEPAVDVQGVETTAAHCSTAPERLPGLGLVPPQGAAGVRIGDTDA